MLPEGAHALLPLFFYRGYLTLTKKRMAHLGVLKALYEAGVPVDWIGGVSIGAQIAGMVAMEYDLNTIIDLISTLYYKTSTWDILSDLTFPFLSLLSGASLSNKLKK